MTTEQIIEGNKLINAFMGYPYNMTDTGYPNEELYHTSWDWLMPVVEKICNLKHPSMAGLPHMRGRVEILPINIGIQTTYEVVVFFITWYNQQQK